jgi:uncharacterized coiled-coil protein SlyX
MTARISNQGAALAILHGQLVETQQTMLKLRKEQMELAKRMLSAQRFHATCCEAMERIINGVKAPVYSGIDLL